MSDSTHDDREGQFAKGRMPDRFYISKRFPLPDTGRYEGLASRLAWQVNDASEDLVGLDGDGFEVVLRETPTRQQLRVLFLEESRVLQRITFQRFATNGSRIDRETFTLKGDEIGRLLLFFQLIGERGLPLDSSSEGHRLSTTAVLQLLRDASDRNQALEELIKSDVNAPDVVAVARRLRDLKHFEQLLNDQDEFHAHQRRLKSEARRSGPEDVWQDFFEQHKWVFGTGVTTQFLHSWDPVRLEQTIVGASMLSAGTRPDAVLRTAGAISALALVEIKTHRTALLEDTPYRSDVWAPSRELVRAVAQCQQAVQAVERQFDKRIERIDGKGHGTDEWTAVCRPRCILVPGTLLEFQNESNVHWERFESFERFRRSLRDVDVVTFDELYERASLSLKDASDRPGPPTEPTYSPPESKTQRSQTPSARETYDPNEPPF